MSGPVREAPPAASVRRYLRGGLPGVYQESPDGGPALVMGFLEGLEEVLDPVVALLDNLSWHLAPEVAPSDMVDLLAGLVGEPVDATLPVAARRRLLTEAATIGRARGTRHGLQRTLELAFPELDPDVRDDGRVTTGRDPRAAPAASPASFEVRVSQEPSRGQVAQIDRCIEHQRPAGTDVRILVGRPERP